MNHFDVILYYDSHFQKVITEHLLETQFQNQSTLVIDAIGGSYNIKDKKYPISFNSIKQSISSFSNINSFPKDLSCKILVGSVLTGSNSTFFLSTIKHEEIHLIDDGIGTPVIIKCGDILKVTNWKFRANCILLKLLFLLKGIKKPLSNVEVLKKIDHYYSIYNESNSLPSTKITPFNTNFTTIKGTIAFIGQAFIEYQMMKKEDYISYLQKVRGNRTLKYYPDPSEKWYENEQIEGIEFQEKGDPLEVRFGKEGIPEHIYTFVSSAILNLKTAFPELNGYFIRVPKSKKSWKYYYDVLADNGIKEFK